MNGKQIIGEYIVNTKRIAKGSFSSIYLGYHNTTKQKVAVKCMEIDSIKKVAQRIRKEIQICKTLSHPNIVSTLDVVYDKSGGNIYLILEYCSGGDLSQFLKGRAMKEKYVRKFMYQISKGLKYLSDNQILHRDLKPQNILLDEKGDLKIADFGFARYIDGDTMVETLCGTPLYMAPEIIKKQKYNEKSDLWSVGVIMYQMLFGIRPYNAKNIMDLLNQIENKDLFIPKNKITHYCEDLLRKLLVKDYNQRITWKEFFIHPWIEMEGKFNNYECSKSLPDNLNSIESLNDLLPIQEKQKDEKNFKNSSDFNTSDSINLSNSSDKDYPDLESSNYSEQSENELNINKSINIPKNINNTNNINNKNNINNIDNTNNISKGNEIKSLEYKRSQPIPIKNNKNFNLSNNLKEDYFSRGNIVSPMFVDNNDYIMIKDKDVHVINSKNRDNYMDKELSDDEDTIIGDDKIKFRNNSSVKDAINNSIDYLKNSMYYFALFKNNSM